MIAEVNIGVRNIYKENEDFQSSHKQFKRTGFESENLEIYHQSLDIPKKQNSPLKFPGRRVASPAMIYMNQTEIHADEPV